MEKYAVVSNVNGNFFIDSEWTDNLDGAITAWYDRCKVLRKAGDVQKAVVKVLTTDLLAYGKYTEIIGETSEEPKFAVINVTDGNFGIVSEWGTNLEGAIKGWFIRGLALWSDQATERAVLRIMNDNLETYTHYGEYIGHEVTE